MDKLRAIRCFCRVVEAKSFVAAAHLLNVPPSVVSRVISSLETDLKCTLFNRTTRRLSLTEAGAIYYERSRQLLLDLEESDTIAREGSARPSGTLRVGYHPAFRVLLLRRLGEYLGQNPSVDVELTIANSPSTLLDEGLDIVLRIGRVADSGLVATQLGWTSYVTCAAPAYLDRRGRPRHPSDLRGHLAVIPGRRDEESFARWTFTKGKNREIVTVPVCVVARDGVGLTDATIGQAGGGATLRCFLRSSHGECGAGADHFGLVIWTPSGLCDSVGAQTRSGESPLVHGVRAFAYKSSCLRRWSLGSRGFNVRTRLADRNPTTRALSGPKRQRATNCQLGSSSLPVALRQPDGCIARPSNWGFDVVSSRSTTS
jgi:DNA-binding transcriptional LysR family regulator